MENLFEQLSKDLRPQSKIARVKRHLLSGASITGLQAIKWFGLYRLAPAISRLRAKGMNIKTEMVTIYGSTFARYSIKK